MSSKQLAETERVQAQTTDEWLEEYQSGVKVMPQSSLSPPPDTVRSVNQPRRFRYWKHRTVFNKQIGKGFLVLCFIDLETDEDASLFFNVDTTIQRGPYKGQNRAMRVGGQFLPPERGNFRKFWMSVVGRAPRRWSTVHKEMKAALCRLEFTGMVEVDSWPNGDSHLKILNIRVA